ncbi:hypothetical protein GCM10023215_19820 [Pseudonocardia yuanmonensis]|uniref:Metallo-beta-lactamase domain-containing protein n=1 Tax=Pseudonocardia yuanmonensis TaxID=1095914 RepID=A0ABP8WCT1_9PSEU
MSEALAPVETQLETFDEEVELFPGLRARPAPGHTPGSTVFVLSDAGERALLLGDVVHTVNELTDPEWEGMFDVDREAANAIRARIADELAATGDPFAPAHLPGLSFGRLVTADGLASSGSRAAPRPDRSRPSAQGPRVHDRPVRERPRSRRCG